VSVDKKSEIPMSDLWANFNSILTAAKCQSQRNE